MRRSFLVATILLLGLPALSLAQRVTVKGKVTDASNGEPVTGAIVVVKENPKKGAITDLHGNYSMKIEKGKYTFVCQTMGYLPKEQPVEITDDMNIDFSVQTEVKMQEETVVTFEKKDENVQSTDVGKLELDVDQAKLLPALFGEVDLMKTIQLLPGIMSAGEGNAGLYVRGGGPDQNLVLFDDAVVYNSSHLFGFFSVFNADAVSSVDLYKGGIPAQYGGRLSSVVDFGMKDGNMEKWHANGGIGLISSRLTVDGPIFKDKTSLLVSGRRTYIDVLTDPFLGNSSTGGIPYYFYDVNAKLTHKFSVKDKLTLSSYYGRDVTDLNLLDGRFKAKFFWGNLTSTLKWTHIFSDKIHMSLSGIYNNYRFDLKSQVDNFSNDYISRIDDYSGKLNFDFFFNEKNKMKVGVNHTFHIFVPRRLKFETTDVDDIDFENSVLNETKRAHEAGVYITHESDITDELKVTAGFRLSYFAQMGLYKLVNETTSDTTVFGRGDKVKDWWGAEPRINIRYKLDSVSSIKAAVTVNKQYMHLTSLTGNALPFDIWVPSSYLVEPQSGIQYSLGYYRNFKDNLYETSGEVFYRTMNNVIEYREDFAFSLTGELESDLRAGNGVAYGLELFFKKRLGKLQGWIGYTLSKTERTFEDINNGETFPARYDRRHDLSVVGTYKLNKRVTLGAQFVYGTGQAVTIQEGMYLFEQTVVNVWGDRNGFRMPAYHRFDISCTLHQKKERKWKSDWVFAIYNVYNRANPYLIYIDSEGNPISGNLKVTPKMLYIFPMLPSVTWNFKF